MDRRKNNDGREYLPWFGVRRPSSGGLQLVFGCLNNRFGIDKGQFPNLAKELEKYPGFTGVHWITVTNK